MSGEAGSRKNPFTDERLKQDDQTMELAAAAAAAGVQRYDTMEKAGPSHEIIMTDSYMEISQQVDMNPMPEPSISGREEGTNTKRRPDSLISNSSFPYDLAGTVSKEGEMTHFVADNLEYKIKLSSPAGKIDMSTPSSSGVNPLTSRFFAQTQDRDWQNQQARIDPTVLSDIEIEAQYLAASLDNLTENLCNLLHSISSITADNVEIHKNAVNKLTDSMDANIKSMYTIMAKTEEISKSMKPTEQLAGRIREIKKLVDMLDSNM